VTRVLVVWEDDYCEPLGVLLKRVVRAHAPSPDADLPRVLRHTSRGSSAFDRYAHTTWPAIRARGLPADPGPVDHLVCVVDADRLHELLPARVPHPPTEPTAVGAWHTAAEHGWREHLRAQCDPNGPPVATVHGVVLRWAKESLLLAGYDEAAMEAHLDLAVGHPDVATALARCTPRPADVADARFTDTYHRPSKCLKQLREARGLAPLHKRAPEIDDALTTLARDSLAKVCSRVPDLARLAALVWELHRGAPEPTAVAEPASRAKKKSRKA
jgi:hypothetical protein